MKKRLILKQAKQRLKDIISSLEFESYNLQYKNSLLN